MQVHLILRHKSPKTGEIEEKHLTGAPMIEQDKATHVYTAILKPDNTCARSLLAFSHMSRRPSPGRTSL